MSRNIIQLHACVPFYIEPMSWASIALPSWEGNLDNRRNQDKFDFNDIISIVQWFLGAQTLGLVPVGFLKSTGLFVTSPQEVTPCTLGNYIRSKFATSILCLTDNFKKSYILPTKDLKALITCLVVLYLLIYIHFLQ